MRELVGQGHWRIAESLANRVRAVARGQVDVPRMVLLEGPSGIGKSRVVRELYRSLRTELDRDGYWPSLEESGGGDFGSRDPLPGRKTIGPEVVGFVWPADALPGFAWWQLHGERMQAGQAIDVVAQVRPELEAHLIPVALAWKRAASLKEKATAKKGVLVSRVQEALAEGGLEAASQLLAKFDLAVPGLGTAASWLFRGFRAAREHREFRRAAMSEVDIGAAVDERRRSVSAELAALISGVAHPRIPAVMVIEDLHLMDDSLGELLDRLTIPDAAHPVIVVGMCWPEARDATAFGQWRRQAVADGRAERVEMPYLTESELIQILKAYAPNTADAVATQAARRYPNPLALEATLGSRIVQTAIAANDDALPAEALTTHPVKLDDIYRDRFRELSEEVQLALAAGAGSLPRTVAGSVWPFIPALVVEAVHRCPTLAAKAADVLAGIEHAAEGNVWLVPSGVATSFREALQAQVAYEYLTQEVLLPVQVETLRQSVVDVLVEWIDTARGDSYFLDSSDQSGVISRWLLAAATTRDRAQTLIAAAYHGAADLASTYRYSEAVEALTPYLTTEFDNHRDVLAIRGELADWLGESGRVDEAIAAFEQLLDDQLRLMGPDTPDTLTTRNDLAHWLGESGRVDDAITMLEQLRDDQLRVMGPDAPDTLITRNNFAYFQGLAGRNGEAIFAFEQLLEDQLRLMGPDATATLTTRGNLARWLGHSGRVDDAIAAFKQLLDDQLRVMGPDAPDTFITRNNLAEWLGESGRYSEAISVFEQLLADQARVLGPDAPVTLVARGNRARWLSRAGRVDEAIPAFEELLDDQARVLGPDAPVTLTTRSHIAYGLAQASRLGEAMTAFGQLLADRTRVLGPYAPATLHTLSDLANCLARAGEFADALTLYEDVLAAELRVLGPDHPNTLLTRRHLAFWKGGAGRLDEAITAFEELLVDQTRVLGPDAPNALITRGYLADCLGRAGRVDEAITAVEALLRDQTRVCGPDTPETLNTRRYLVHWTGKSGQIEEAVAACKQLLADHLRVLGPNATATLTTRKELAHWTDRAAGDRR
jgi:tetratricopeptide (TPR) repeat protein